MDTNRERSGRSIVGWLREARQVNTWYALAAFGVVAVISIVAFILAPKMKITDFDPWQTLILIGMLLSTLIVLVVIGPKKSLSPDKLQGPTGDGTDTGTERVDLDGQDFAGNLYSGAGFIGGGFIGLQQKMYEIESDKHIGKGFVRMTVLRYIPSYMRRNPLESGKGIHLWQGWEPLQYVSDYVKLINQRMKCLEHFLDNGGIVREIYLKDGIERYVKERSAFYDGVVDPVDEIKERLGTLLHYLKNPNYYLCLLDEYPHIPNFLLKTNVGMVIDLRSSEQDRQFTKSIDGIYTSDKEVLKEFERKFRLLWKHSSNQKERNRGFLENLLQKMESIIMERKR